jgi:hypothetical protein
LDLASRSMLHHENHYAAYLANSDGYEVELVADDP